jgi:hypothetical protein
LKFTAFELGGGLWNLAGKPLELFKSFQISPWLVGEEGQGRRRPNSNEESDGGWRRTGPLASGAQGASRVGLGGRGGGRRWGSHGGRDGGEEELVGEGLPGEEGG